MNEIVKLEKLLLKETHTEEFEVDHKFAEGMYIRQLIIPVGGLVVGKRHRHKTLNILLKGKMIIHDGNTSIEIEAPFMVESLPYTKKAGYALEDSIWCNIHVTNETDLDKIEKEFIIPEEEYQQLTYEENICLG